MVKRPLPAALALLGALCLASAFAQEPAAPDTANLPDWLRDSEQLSRLLGGEAVGEVSGATVIARRETPVQAVEALVIEGTVTREGQAPRLENFVIYVDVSGRYLFAGLLIDMQTGENYSTLVAREVRGARADNPALALHPREMHAIPAEPATDDANVLLVVVDLGPEKGRQNLLNIAERRAALQAEGRAVRPLRIVPVSAGPEELSTAAMALALGYEQQTPGDGYAKLIAYARDSGQADWLDVTRLANDPVLKHLMAGGVFQLENNSTQALLARLDTLPLVYTIVDGQARYLPTPTSQDAWTALLRAPVETP